MQIIRRVGLGLMSVGVFGIMGVGTALGFDRWLESVAVGEADIAPVREQTVPPPAALATPAPAPASASAPASAPASDSASASDSDSASATATATATATDTDTAADPATITVPDLDGLRISEARRRLRALGLRMSATFRGSRLYPEDHRYYRVRTVEPAAGTRVEPGSTVRLRSRPIYALADGY